MPKYNYRKTENPKDFLPLSHRGLGVYPKSLGGKGGKRGIGTVRKGSFSPLIIIRKNQVVGCDPIKQTMKLLNIFFIESFLKLSSLCSLDTNH